MGGHQLGIQDKIISGKEVREVSMFNKTKSPNGVITQEFFADSRIEMYDRVKYLFLDKGWTFVTPVEEYIITGEKYYAQKDGKYKGSKDRIRYRCVMRSDKKE